MTIRRGALSANGDVLLNLAVTMSHAGYRVDATRPDGSAWSHVAGLETEADAKFAAKILARAYAREQCCPGGWGFGWLGEEVV